VTPNLGSTFEVLKIKVLKNQKDGEKTEYSQDYVTAIKIQNKHQQLQLE
jgi:hypothetical protein